MAYAHHSTDLDATGQGRADGRLPAELEPMRGGSIAGRLRHGSTEKRSSEPQELNAKLIDAWKCWAASRLG
jgi:hypothetical protein